MQDANPVCAFSSNQARSSVLGIRPSALIRSRVPGARYPEPGTRYLAPVFEKPAHGVCKMQDGGGGGAWASGAGYLRPGCGAVGQYGSRAVGQ